MSEYENPDHEAHEEEKYVEVVVDGVITLPEYLRRRTIESLLPDQIVYKYPSCMADDEATNGTYMDARAQVEVDEFTLPNYVHEKKQVAIMPILHDDGRVGYVIDATGIKPGDIHTYADISQVFDDESHTMLTPDAIAFTNLDHKIELHGTQEYFDHLRFVIETYTQAVAANVALSQGTLPEITPENGTLGEISDAVMGEAVSHGDEHDPGGSGDLDLGHDS